MVIGDCIEMNIGAGCTKCGGANHRPEIEDLCDFGQPDITIFELTVKCVECGHTRKVETDDEYLDEVKD